MNVKAQNLAKAVEIWKTLNKSERFGCQCGMFPALKMAGIAKEDTPEVAIALMDMAQQPNYLEGAVK